MLSSPHSRPRRGLIGAEELAALTPGALFVDLSRGGVTDTDALVAALESGQLRGAAVDVFEQEPLPAESPLWKVPNLLVTPHVAGNSLDYQRLIAVQFQANLEALERGETPPRIVDHHLGY
ncbi:MAG: NAD(P)-dependent oxidoreductase [Acidimicrobiales bacterium]